MHGRTFNTGAIDSSRDRSDTSSVNNNKNTMKNDRKCKKIEKSNGQKRRIKRRTSNGFKIRAVLFNRMYHSLYLYRLSSYFTLYLFPSSIALPCKGLFGVCLHGHGRSGGRDGLFTSFSFSLAFFLSYWSQIGTPVGALFLLAIFFFNSTLHRHRFFALMSTQSFLWSCRMTG